MENSIKCYIFVVSGLGSEEFIGDIVIGGLNGGRGGS